METDATDGSKLPGAEEGGGGGGGVGGGVVKEEGVADHDKESDDILQNAEFLHSVLSSLPGVNPEEALQNLKEMTEAVEEGGDEKDKKNNEESTVCC